MVVKFGETFSPNIFHNSKNKIEILCRIIKVKIIVLFIGRILPSELTSREFLISYTRRV